MNPFYELFTNYYLMSAVAAWLTAQILKVFTGIFNLQEFTVRAMLFGTGGMPSSHTAAVCGLMTAAAVRDGFGSFYFAIAALLTIVVIVDATGVRRETGKQSKALNAIVGELYESKPESFDVKFKELIGHTPLQVFFGVLTGIGVALLLSLIPVFGV